MTRHARLLPPTLSVHHAKTLIAVLFATTLHALLRCQERLAHRTVALYCWHHFKLVVKKNWISILDKIWIWMRGNEAVNALDRLTVQAPTNWKINTTSDAQKP